MSLPHARGGVSIFPPKEVLQELSSPRPWGCFHVPERGRQAPGVFPTPVGVFLNRSRAAPVSSGLPHARGGVSGRSGRVRVAFQSSPRPWGCF